jgi:hypothetical protein
MKVSFSVSIVARISVCSKRELLAPETVLYINGINVVDHGFNITHFLCQTSFLDQRRPSGLGPVRCPKPEDETSDDAVSDRIPCAVYTS